MPMESLSTIYQLQNPENDSSEENFIQTDPEEPLGSPVLFDEVPFDDYSYYFQSMIDNQNAILENQTQIIEQNTIQNQLLNDVSDNCFRLYYFIGGLYVVFFILLAIRFFKIFF